MTAYRKVFEADQFFGLGNNALANNAQNHFCPALAAGLLQLLVRAHLEPHLTLHYNLTRTAIFHHSSHLCISPLHNHRGEQRGGDETAPWERIGGAGRHRAHGTRADLQCSRSQ
jgi:hypothetical protein